MQNLLNRRLNFCITPGKINPTQILANFDKFGRNFSWAEYWAKFRENNKDDDATDNQNVWTPPVFKVETRQVYNLFQDLRNKFLGFFQKVFMKKMVQKCLKN